MDPYAMAAYGQSAQPQYGYGQQGQLQLDGSPTGQAAMLPAPFGLEDWRTVDSQDELGRAAMPSAAALSAPYGASSI